MSPFWILDFEFWISDRVLNSGDDGTLLPKSQAPDAGPGSSCSAPFQSKIQNLKSKIPHVKLT